MGAWVQRQLHALQGLQARQGFRARQGSRATNLLYSCVAGVFVVWRRLTGCYSGAWAVAIDTELQCHSAREGRTRVSS